MLNKQMTDLMSPIKSQLELVDPKSVATIIEHSKKYPFLEKIFDFIQLVFFVDKSEATNIVQDGTIKAKMV
jgi:hypothetical protein